MTAAPRSRRPVPGRPWPWATDAEFRALIAQTQRQGDRHILLALRLHDLEPDNSRGAIPGYRRLAELTGLDAGYIRNRLSGLRRDGAIRTDRNPGTLTGYFIVRPGPVTAGSDTAPQPVISESDTATSDTIPPLVTAGSDMQGDTFSPHVTGMSPPEVHSKGKKNRTTSPKSSDESVRGIRQRTEAQALTDHVITVGMLGQRFSSDYGKQATRADTLLQCHSLEELKRAADALRSRFPYSDGRAFDVFDLGKNADKVLAELRSPAADPAIARALRERDRAKAPVT
jgi:hypothetical protein